MLRSIRSSLRSIVGSTFDTGNVAYSLFVQIGIASDQEGRLTLNRGELEEALETDEDAVRSLFTDSTNGIATRLYNQIDLYTDSVDGLIKTRLDGFDTLIKQADRQIEQGERRLEGIELGLRNQFATLETLMAQLQGQGAALGSLQFPTQTR
jgi:flagellar hook-associated protein 2